VAAVEGPAAISPIAHREAEAAGPEPPLPRAQEGAASARNGCISRREGNPYRIFFHVPATARAATGSLTAPGGRRCSGFAPLSAGTLWSASFGGRGVGANGGRMRGELRIPAEPGIPCGPDRRPISSRHIAPTPTIPISSACAQLGRGSEACRSWHHFVLSSS
jgi:hypothetical protein